jgi:hypothetical protein
VNGDHSHLRIGLRVVQLAAEAVQPRNRLGREHAGIVADVIDGFGQAAYLLGRERHGGSRNQGGHEQPESNRNYAVKAFHRS